jgi:NAD+ synthetase
MRIALGQINTTIGDFAGNLAKIQHAASRAREAGAEILVLPELALCGYPPMDLLQRPSFLRDQAAALAQLAEQARDLVLVCGALLDAPAGASRPLLNAAVVLADGAVAHHQAKTLLPTYDVFDEARHFEPASVRALWTFGGCRIGFAICEDLWSGEFWGERAPYAVDPVADLVAQGARLVLAVSASPWEQGKAELREDMIAHAAEQHGVPIVFVNLVGGNDELVFDGSSFAVDAQGGITARLASFAEDFAVVDALAAATQAAPERTPRVQQLESALVLGIGDYLHKLGLEQAVIGLSGGIDSSVTADLAVRALGAENVLGVLMPGPFSSEHSISDAESLAERLGIETRTVRIDSIYKAFLEQFRGLFGAAESYGLTQENLQARVRGTLLMAISNFENRIVLATGNKSELSVGYTTLYGDLIGGLAVLGDVLKRDVYALARNANRDGVRIPENAIEKPPSAELAPDQLDSDSLPPYDVLDQVLSDAIERRIEPGGIQAPTGSRPDDVAWVLGALDRTEYKRRQAPLVLRVSAKAFGTGRRIPIVHRSGWGL